MATCDHPSGLVHRIAYPSLEKKWFPTDSRVASFPAKEEKQLHVSSSQQGIEDSLFREIETGARLQRNPLAAAASLAFQLLVLLTLVVVPLYHVETLPKREMITKLYFQPPAAAHSSALKLQAPTSAFTPTNIRIPTPVHETQETRPTPPPAPVAPMVLDGVPGGAVGGPPVGALGEFLGSSHSVPVAPKTSDPAPIKRVHVPARITEANLLYDVPPTYPPEAGRARIEGTVVLAAVIGKDGRVQDVRVENGLPILAQAAVDAVKQWRYKPYLLNGEPVEIESRITINFTLSRS